MESISLREVFRKAACQIESPEDVVWGDLNSAMAGMTKVLLEVLAESAPACTSAARAGPTIGTATGRGRLN